VKCDILSEESSLLKKLLYRIIKKHIAGTTAASAIKVLKSINKEGIKTTVTFLNDLEDCSNQTKTRYNFTSYLQLSKELFRLMINSDISIRLSQLGYPQNDGIIEDLPEILKYIPIKNVLWIEYEPKFEFEKMYDFIKEINNPQLGLEVSTSLLEDKSTLNKIMELKNVKLVPFDYRNGNLNTIEVKIKKKVDAITEYQRILSKIQKYKYNIHILMPDEKITQKLIDADKKTKKGLIKKNLTFELLLGSSNRKIKSIKSNGVNLCIYVAYGKDWMEYAANRLTTGRIHDISLNMLDTKKENVGDTIGK
jgi:proline dehydrogenase